MAKTLGSSPPLHRVNSPGDKWWVESLQVYIHDDGTTWAGFREGAADADQAGQGPFDGPWLNLVFWQDNAIVYEAVNVFPIMTPDGKTVLQQKINISDKVDPDAISTATRVEPKMASDGHVR